MIKKKKKASDFALVTKLPYPKSHDQKVEGVVGGIGRWGAFLVAQTVKCLPAMQGSQVRSLGWEDPQEKEMATHSSILAWKIPWTAEPGRLLSMGLQRVKHD